MEESPDQAASAKAGEVAAGEFFLYRTYFCLALIGFLRYPIFHLLSASFVVLVVFWTTFYYYVWRHFCLEKRVIGA
jgi:uncharacterized membrane protein